MRRRWRFAWLACAIASSAAVARAQGVTSGSIAGTVTDPQGRAAPGATITAVHEPSGSRWETVSRADGRFAVPGLRVGGPYRVTVALAGFTPASERDLVVALGVSTDLSLRLGDVAATEEITVTARAPDVFSSARTGAATTVGRGALATLPTIGDRINDYARLTPQYTGTATQGGYAGTDGRLNDITVDGSSFNASFLGGQPGDGTGVAPIATEALEEIQVNVAPYDVRHANFVGAGINSVTRSGGNQFRGSAYYRFRDDGLVGREAAGRAVDAGRFEYDRWGAWASGPLIRDRLSLFLGVEDDTLAEPGTTFRARSESEQAGGNTTRVLASDLDALATFLRSRFDYDPGAYQGYTHETPAARYLGKLNLDLGVRNKLSVRYAHLDSTSDVLVSNAPLLGFGNRRGNTTGLNFQNSNYANREDIRSAVAEWNWVIGTNGASRLLIGYTANDESRSLKGRLFPLVDILDAGTVYTTFGSEPFTPGNERRYHTLQVQENLSWVLGSHALAFGASAERFASENSFAPGSQGVYVYNSLADFYADAEDHLAHPDRTVSPVTLRRFQVRWTNVPGLETPVQRLALWYTGVHAQDEWQVHRRLKLTYGLRVDVPFFDDTGFRNAEADALTFRERGGEPVRYQTRQLPRSNVLWSPRAGFNWSLDGARRTQVRGGTGVFTGRPPYVWLSSQVGGTGVLTGFAQLDNTRLRPFNPSPEAYKPTEVTGAPPSSYELTLADPGFRFPQVWRSNLAVDRRLPWGITATLEGIHTREVNGIQFINVNLPQAQGRLAGADERPRWTRNRIHPNITSAIVLVNHDQGDAWNVAVSLARAHRAGFVRAAYARGDSRTPAEPGGTALSWIANPHSGDPNDTGAQFFSRSQRAFVAGSHRFEYGKRGATTISFFFEGRNDGRASYTYAGDLNGDGGAGNDLIYVPRGPSETTFQPFTSGGRSFTADEQAAAWDAYIAQDPYLSRRRGRYAERNGFVLPMVWRLDVSVAQELFARPGGRRHALELRADLLNLTNLLDGDWGVGRRLVSAQPLTNAVADAQGRPTYRLRVIGERLIARSLEPSATLADVYRIQFGVKYSFQ